ncbi:proline-specific peptidase [Lentinula guzmanii]|uniref:Proline-specific peptidase n=1 Tax=Lentinula guzmanii TaxID=2804957 RepID=A0AA38J880_9AGAR|nr:proline-specific peptidase [Lentinula guzmanii]
MACNERVEEVPFLYNGVTYKTWVKVVGDLENNTRTPLIALHGGPGLSHDYMIPHIDLAVSSSIPVILYDQVGSARSSHFVSYRGVAPPNSPNETPPITIDLFIAELSNLINHLKIASAFDIVGHSWGGVLGVEYAIRSQPPGLRHLVLVSSLASTALWGQSVMQLSAAALPDQLRNELVQPTSMGKHREALDKLHAVHGCTCVPVPDEVKKSLDYAASEEQVCDTTVPQKMFAGEFGSWSCIGRLDRVLVPTLIINGRKDLAQDFVLQPFFDGIPRVKWVKMEKSSHMAIWEERERYMFTLAQFLST